MDKMEQDVDDKIMTLELTELIALAEELGLEEKYHKDSSVVNTRRGIRKWLEADEEDKMKQYNHVLKAIGQLSAGRTKTPVKKKMMMSLMVVVKS